MSDFGLLRSPLAPSNNSINRASSPSGNRPTTMNPHSRYSLGKGASTEHMMRLAQQGNSGLDGNVRSPSIGGATAMPGTAGSRNLRPSSEMLPNMNHHGTPETEAIDRWFEDLQHYEATLEEMAAASLDQNFKEELSAIEQWFRVLSEAERTAALYSLLQESTQVQIRFFITVLQQMARSDPVSALLSPSHHNSSMADQMEAKLASLGLKSPSAMKAPASPGNRGYRQSSDAAGFLSPNVAAMYSPGNADAASTLAAQRAKLKANRTSAPGTLIGESRNYSGGQLDQVQERGGSPNPQQQQQRTLSGDHSRPKSTDLSNNVGRSPRASGPLDDQLSPITATGNWSSMVNTPLVPMFSDNEKAGTGEANVNLDTAAAQLANLQQQQHLGGNGRVMVDPDVPRYRRKSNQNTGAGGYGSNVYDQSSPGVSPNIGMQSGWGQNDNFGRGGLNAGSGAFGGNNGANGSNQFNIPPMSPNALAGLQSPSGGLANPLNLQMMNMMAAMGGLNLNNMNGAQLLAMQQQLLQNQQTLSVLAQQQQMQSQQQQQQQHGRNLRAFGGGALSPGIGGQAGRKSPRSGTSPSGRSAALPGSTGGAGGASGGANAGGGEEEIADLATLNDVPAWLRQLRLHKYTPNFETSHWKEMVLMDDKQLEDKGVAALGARRKMLKTFELVRKKYGIKMDGEDEPGSGVPGSSHNDKSAAEGGDEAGESNDAQEVDRELGGAASK